MRTLFRRLPALLSLLLVAVSAAAEEERLLFDNHETIAVSIDAPIAKIKKERDSEEYHEGTLTYTDSAGLQKTLDVKLRARGRYRRQPKTCNFPPIRLNFKVKQVKGTVFAGQDKLKLVTHCRDDSEYYEQLVLKEYLTYRMFQEMTDYSFRVRLLKIRWNDSAEDSEPLEHYGFLLEDEELLGKRLGLTLAKVRSTSPEKLIAQQTTLASLYEYLIGNTDFSMLLGPAGEFCCHNIVLYDAPDGHLPIPYDFDFSGFVNAPYAEPNPKLKLRSVTSRLFRGRCEHNDQLDTVMEQFRAKKNALFALIEQQEGASDRTRKSTSGYMGDFYKIIDQPKRVKTRIFKKCV